MVADEAGLKWKDELAQVPNQPVAQEQKGTEYKNTVYDNACLQLILF